MAGELKREERPSGDAPLRSRVARPALESPRPAVGRRWFAALGPRAAPSRRAYVAPPLVAAALVFVALARSVVLRVLLPLALALAAVALLVRSQRSRSQAVQPRRRGIAFTDGRLAFESDGPTQTLLFTDAPFGVTLLANRGRQTIIALLSSSTGTFSIGASVDSASRHLVASLFDMASTAADEFGLDAIGPDGQALLLDPSAFAELVDALVASSPSCLERFVLSDTRGAPITLDFPELAIGDRLVDLAAPLEWRSLVFEEAFGASVAKYQGTWVRQGATEMVLVSLLSSMGSGFGEAELGELDRGGLRDLRLMQATPAPPPPTDQRVAIERLFMLPLRAALDRAPRASRRPSRALA